MGRLSRRPANIGLRLGWVLMSQRISEYTRAAKRQYSPRKPTLLSIARQAQKAGIEVARYEVEPSGKIIVITSKGDSAGVEPNPWNAEIAKLRAATPKGKGQQ